MPDRGTRHHTIVVADVEGFGDPQRIKPHQRAVREGLYRVMQAAFTAAGVPWENCYHEDRGDAVFVLAPADADKAVFAEALPPALVTGLRTHNATHPDEQRIRLRLALHAGEVHYDDHGVSSSSLTLTFRLCDATPLKEALTSSPGVLAVIASSWFFDDVVRHTPGAAPSTWHSIPVEVKEVVTTGWITLPDHPYPPGTTSTLTDPKRVVPRQLPPAVHDFTGRAELLETLNALLPRTADSPDGQAQSVVITAVDGSGGIGKTALAVHWAHRVQDNFPDGTLHMNLRGYGPGSPAAPGEVLVSFLRALDTPPRKIPADVEARAALFRSLLAGKRMLIVLDNAHHSDQIRPLLPGAAGCMVLVTSRDSLTGLVVTDAAHRLTLDLLTPQEALRLVTGIIGPERAAAESDSVAELIKLCARLPLALRIAASRVAAHPHLTVADLVAELADDRSRLDVLSQGGDERAAIRTVFDWSYQQLPPEQARLFRRLGLHPGPDFSLPAAAAIAEHSPAATKPLLTALTDAHLVEPTAGGRYRFHDLLRTYAAERARQLDSAGHRHQAVESVLTWYTHTVRCADQLLFPMHQRLRIVVAEPPHPHALGDVEYALHWLTSERENVLAALHYSAEHKLDHHTIPLADASGFIATTVSWQAWLDTADVGLIAARRTVNRTYEAHFQILRGEAALNLRLWERARDDFDRAAALVLELDNDELSVWVLNDRGLLFHGQERFDDALRCLNEALPLSRGIDNGRWEAVVEGNIGAAHTGLGEYHEALDHGLRGLHLRRKTGDRSGESMALTHLAEAWQGLGEHKKAIALCRDAIAIGRGIDLNRHETIAAPSDVLAASLYSLGHVGEAIRCWTEAAAIYDGYGLTHKASEVRRHLDAASDKE
ncbi:Regulatory protein AfsR [Amycolatopsis sp. YIM 10]|nr:Regulatory protein AfsR [Amycolatopsis sp. YIM 10]